MNTLRWNIDKKVEEEISAHYRTGQVDVLSKESSQDIISKLTFDGVSPNFGVKEAEGLIIFLNKKVISDGIEGIGLELGAGCGFFSSILAKNEKVEKVYAIEAVPGIVDVLMPKISEFVLGDKKEKVIGVVGEFDNLELPDSSVDFIFEFFSLHHSGDLGASIKEAHRVLKPGGFIVCLDKARSNKLTNEEIKLMLDKEYPVEAKAIMGISADKVHTRRMNGEREYRLSDWERFFKDMGFTRFNHFHLARITTRQSVARYVKEVISILPVGLQAFISRFFRPSSASNKLETSSAIYSHCIDNFAKDFSILVGYK